MKKFIVIITIAVVVLAALIFFVYPKKIVDCSGEKYCIGYLHNYEQEEVWLNLIDSVVEKENKSHNSCYGFEYTLIEITDGCPGDWGWYDERPFDCEYLLEKCGDDNDNRLIIGITCREIKNACIDINIKDKVPINIVNVGNSRS